MKQPENCFLEIEGRQICKSGQNICGDVFKSRRMTDENRVVTVLADGLGSGVKASVLATLTATFAGRCVEGRLAAVKTAEFLMSILPVCRERKIAYSTFTIADTGRDCSTMLVEYGNPPAVWMRGPSALAIPRQTIKLTRPDGVEDEMYFSRFSARKGDRLILLSDGVTHAGIGERSTPVGWGTEEAVRFISGLLQKNGDVSARELASSITCRAHRFDLMQARDDITCGVVTFREPRHLMVVTGPPMARERDSEMADIMDCFPGRRIVCGGTTGSLLARELNRRITLNLSEIDPYIPPYGEMEGVELVTEGTLTLAEVVRLAENPDEIRRARPHAASKVVDSMLDSDVIHFLVGTRINEAHQDPNIPVDLDIRRNIVKRIRNALENTFLKETRLRYI